MEEGATVDLTVENGRLLIRPLRVRRYSLNVLLGNVSRRNLHGEVGTTGATFDQNAQWGSQVVGQINSSNVATYITQAVIDTAYIKDAAITNAKIAQLAVNEANIVDAAVKTLKIGGNAVTAPTSFVHNGETGLWSGWSRLAYVVVDFGSTPATYVNAYHFLFTAHVWQKTVGTGVASMQMQFTFGEDPYTEPGQGGAYHLASCFFNEGNQTAALGGYLLGGPTGWPVLSGKWTISVWGRPP